MVMSHAQLSADHAAIIADLPETAIIGGTAYACNRVTMRFQELQARNRDFVDGYKFSLSFVYDDVSGFVPEPGDLITYNGTEYRVLSLDVSPDFEDLRIHLEDKYHG